MINDSKKKTSSSADRLATCALICGIAGIVCSFFYIPMSLMSGGNYPSGLIFGVMGIVLALLSKRADERPRPAFQGKAIAGIVFGCIAIGLTFFFFYALINYYDALRDPVMGPQINEILNRLQEQLMEQMNQQQTPSAVPGSSSFGLFFRV
jgi:membrane associated rhomboid family serine protease